MPTFSDVKLDAIEDGLARLDPGLQQFGTSFGFALQKGHEHSADIPRRWLKREVNRIRQEIGLVVAIPMDERLARGFWPEIPLSLYITAQMATAHNELRYYHEVLEEAISFSVLNNTLEEHLTLAQSKLQACTPDFVAERGETCLIGAGRSHR